MPPLPPKGKEAPSELKVPYTSPVLSGVCSHTQTTPILANQH